MTNYIIEGNIDFYSELSKSLDENLNEGYCLISNLPLTDNYVELECHHKFNYVPLFNDLYNHKKKYNALEARKLKLNELRCPYCRFKQSTLLPYYDNMNIKKVHGINWINPNELNTYSFIGLQEGKCCWGEESNHTCGVTNVLAIKESGMTYCYYHYKIVSKILLQEKKKAEKIALMKEKAAKKELVKKERELAKQQLKEERAKQRAELKEKKQLEKIKEKLENKKQKNIIISNNTQGCSGILKSGPRKGESCGGKIKQNGYCGRHLKN